MVMGLMGQWVTPEEAEAQERQQREEAAALVLGHQKNVAIFEKLWLSMGADVLKCSNQSHRAESDEGLALAAHRWNRLLDLEAQIVREQQALAARSKKRPGEPNDRMLAPSVVTRLGREHEQQTKGMQEELTEIRKQATAERKALEALVTTKKG
jgi:hypothetical protein